MHTCEKCDNEALAMSRFCRACLNDHLWLIRQQARADENLERFRRRQAKRGKRLPALYGEAIGEVIK